MKRTALKTDVVDTRYAGHQSMRQSQMPQDMWLLLNGGGRGGGGALPLVIQLRSPRARGRSPGDTTVMT